MFASLLVFPLVGPLLLALLGGFSAMRSVVEERFLLNLRELDRTVRGVLDLTVDIYAQVHEVPENLRRGLAWQLVCLFGLGAFVFMWYMDSECLSVQPWRSNKGSVWEWGEELRSVTQSLVQLLHTKEESSVLTVQQT